MRIALTFVGWILSSLFLLSGFSLLFESKASVAIVPIIWGLIFLPPSYSNTIKRYKLDKSYNWNKDIYKRIVVFLISLIYWIFHAPASQQASKPQTTPTQVSKWAG
jgi:hypothetical protein